MRRIPAWAFGALIGLSASAAALAADDWQAGGGEAWAKVLAAARAEGVVVLAGSPDMAKPMTEGFLRDTGIKLEYLAGGPRDLSSRVARESRAKNLTIDIVIGGANDITLVKEGLAEQIAPQFILPGVTDAKNWTGGQIKWVDSAKTYMFQGAEYVNGQPFINTKVLKPGEIKSWTDMLKPEYRGKIASQDPREPGSGQAGASYLAQLFGLDFIRKLFVDQKAALTPDARRAAEWGARGINPIVLGGSPTDFEYFAAAGLKTLEVGDMLDGPGTLVGGFSIVWQPKGNPHPAATQAFLNWYASRPGQIAYIASKGTPTRRTDVDVSNLADYLMPKPGKQYIDTYTEDFYINLRPKLTKTIEDALKQ